MASVVQPILRNGSCDFARDVIIDREGRIVFVGSCEVSTSAFGTEEVVLWRLNEDGTPDLTFGDGGVVLGPVVGTARTVFERADGTLLKPFVRDGEIVVLDGGPPARGRGVPPVSLPRLLRFHPDGTQDVEFASTSSIAPVLSPPDDEPAAVSHLVIDREGRIVVLGVTAVGSTGVGLRLWRFRPDGNLDTDFGDDGVVTRYDPESDNGVSPVDVAVDGAGRVFVTGSIYRNVRLNTTGLRIASMAIWCFTSDGRPDESFGENGYVTPESYQRPLRLAHFASAMAIDAAGRIVIAGHRPGNEFDAVVWRLNSDGSLDESFGTDEFVQYDRHYGFYVSTRGWDL